MKTIIVIIVLYLMYKAFRFVINLGVTDFDELYKENSDWLEQREKIAMQEKESGQYKVIEKWYFKPASDNQLQLAMRLGIRIPDNPTAGLISDYIGLYREPLEEDCEILEYFGEPCENLCRSHVRHISRVLLSDDDNAREWIKYKNEEDQS